MPKKRISNDVTRKKVSISDINLEDTELLSRIEQLAYDGFYDTEIADKLNISRWQFDEAKGVAKKFQAHWRLPVRVRVSRAQICRHRLCLRKCGRNVRGSGQPL